MAARGVRLARGNREAREGLGQASLPRRHLADPAEPAGPWKGPQLTGQGRNPGVAGIFCLTVGRAAC